MNHYLVVGGNAVSGQQTIKAIQSEDSKSNIIATTSGKNPVPGADETIPNIDLLQPNIIEMIVDAIADRKIKALIYVPARGDVGKPVARALQAELMPSLEYSVIPMLKLVKKTEPKLALWFSGFMWLKPLMLFYGTMTYTKIAMEQLTLRFGDKLKCIRYGMFHSDSVRAISILVQRSLNANQYPEMSSYRDDWKKSGQKFREFFIAMNYSHEESELSMEAKFDRPYRPLEAEDIQIGIKKALFSNTKPILNVVGDWYWEKDELPNWPAQIKKHLDLIPEDLDRYLTGKL